MGYLWFMKKLEKYCFWFRTYQERFKIHDPESLNSIPAVIPVFNIVGERSTSKNYQPVGLLSADSKNL